MWIIKFGVECPGTDGLIAETDTGVRKDVVKRGREDPIKVL